MPWTWNSEVEQSITERIGGLVKETAGIIMDEAKRGTSETQGHISPPFFSEPLEYPFMQTHALTDSMTIMFNESSPLCAYVVADPIDGYTNEHYGRRVHKGYPWDGWAHDWEDGGKFKQVAKPHHVASRPFFFIAIANTTMEILGIWGAA